MLVYEQFPNYPSTPSGTLIPQNSIIELKISNITNVYHFDIPATSRIPQMLAAYLEFIWCPMLKATLHYNSWRCSSEIRKKNPRHSLLKPPQWKNVILIFYTKNAAWLKKKLEKNWLILITFLLFEKSWISQKNNPKKQPNKEKGDAIFTLLVKREANGCES